MKSKIGALARAGVFVAAVHISVWFVVFLATKSRITDVTSLGIQVVIYLCTGLMYFVIKSVTAKKLVFGVATAIFHLVLLLISYWILCYFVVPTYQFWYWTSGWFLLITLLSVVLFDAVISFICNLSIVKK